MARAALAAPLANSWSNGRRGMKLAMLVVAANAVLFYSQSYLSGGASAFVPGSAAPVRRSAGRAQRVRMGAAAKATVLEKSPPEHKQREKTQANGTTFNATLLLSGDRDPISRTDATFAPQWTQCYASYEDASRGHVLEQWVLPDSENSIVSFNAWHQRGLQEGGTKVRCGRTALKGQDIMCLECVAPYQLTPGSLVVTAPSQGVPLGGGAIGSLLQCEAMSLGSGFCKSGSLNLPAGF